VAAAIVEKKAKCTQEECSHLNEYENSNCVNKCLSRACYAHVFGKEPVRRDYLSHSPSWSVLVLKCLFILTDGTRRSGLQKVLGLHDLSSSRSQTTAPRWRGCTDARGKFYICNSDANSPLVPVVFSLTLTCTSANDVNGVQQQFRRRKTEEMKKRRGDLWRLG